MKRSLSILLSIAMVFSMLTSVAFAKEMDAEDKYNELEDKGIFNGYSDGLPHLEDNMTREQAAKIIALVFDLDLSDIPNTPTFSDVYKERWSYKYVEASVDAGIIEGIGNGKFAPKDNVTLQEFAKMLVEGYVFLTDKEYDEDGSVDDADVSAWAQEYVAAALKLGLIGEYDDYTIDADRTFLVESAYVSVEKVEDYKESQKKLEVENIDSDNLREIVIEFNGLLDEVTAENTDHYDLSDGIDVEGAELQEDGKTIVLKVEPMDNQEEYTLEIDGVMNIGGKIIEDFEEEFKPFDGDLPEVEGIEFTGPKSFKITFNEPIMDDENPKDDFIIDDSNVVVKKGSTKLSVRDVIIDQNNERVVNVDLNSKLKDGNEYTITVSKVEDFAGYSNISFKESYDYEDSKEIPTAEVINADQKVIEVEFDKPVSGLTPDHFYHTYRSWKAVEIYADENRENDIDEDEKVTTVFVVFAEETDDDRPLPSGDVEFTIKDDANDSEIVDNWGNEFETTTYDIEIESDREAPTVMDVEVISGSEIEVSFSERIKEFDEDNFEFFDEDGDELDVDHEVDPGNNNESVIIDFDNQEGNTIILEISDLVDDTLYENEMEKYSIELDVDDLTFAGVSRVEFDDNGSKDSVLYIIYKEEVSETAIDPDNYRFYDGNKTTRIHGDFEFFENDKTVMIELTEDDLAELADADKLLISNVEDVNGNKYDGFQISIDIDEFGNVRAKVALNDVTAISRSEITVQFDQELTSVSEDDFKVEGSFIDGDGDIDGLDIEYNDEGTLVTLFLENEIENTGDSAEDDLDIKVSFEADESDPDTHNIFNLAPEPFINGNARVAVDGIAPEVAFRTLGSDKVENVFAIDVDGNNKTDHVIIEFTELISDSSIYKKKFKFNDSDYNDIIRAYATDDYTTIPADLSEGNDTDGIYVVIRVEEQNSSDLDVDLELSTVNDYDIEDVYGNILEEIDDVEVINIEDNDFGFTGSVSLDKASYEIGETVTVTVTDADEDTTNSQDQVNVALAGSGNSIQVTLTETDDNSGVFSGTATLISNVSNNNEVQGTVGGTLTVTYEDDLDSFGNTNVDRTDVANVVDVTPATVQTVESFDNNLNGITDQIVLTFDENVTSDGSGFIIEDINGNPIGVTGGISSTNTITLTLNELDVLTGTAALNYYYVDASGNAVDASNNQLGNIGSDGNEVEVDDKAAPLIIKVEADLTNQDSPLTVVTFSEIVFPNESASQGNFTEALFTYNDVSVSGSTTFESNQVADSTANGLQIINLNADVNHVLGDSADTVDIADDSIYDASGNEVISNPTNIQDNNGI
ncbi:S-layer homology domain-containing protein [Chengkuizengella sediminis]|uniref:S-layer homology domain-containing protein n=1 Tax=Chengkuizengella sediminis TaxID=1885917 RepID=UPI001389D699|nr:S-layer homology domain-containing protein [Chengkuizengella sediminis]NDI34773.1 hypothetical protein [Chengkuizengella sediminis]